MRGRPYADVSTPLRFMPGAREGLIALKTAGHELLLYSARANRALRVDPALDPLVVAGKRRVNRPVWTADRVLHEARYQQMLEFVARELPGVFDAVDDGQQGKPCADLFIDDRCLRYGDGPLSVDWNGIARFHGEFVARKAPAEVANARE